MKLSEKVPSFEFLIISYILVSSVIEIFFFSFPSSTLSLFSILNLSKVLKSFIIFLQINESFWKSL